MIIVNLSGLTIIYVHTIGQIQEGLVYNPKGKEK
jgi:hypothetical protein